MELYGEKGMGKGREGGEAGEKHWGKTNNCRRSSLQITVLLGIFSSQKAAMRGKCCRR
jgi:hypothetical protein